MSLASCEGFIGGVAPVPETPLSCRALSLDARDATVLAVGATARMRASGGSGSLVFSLEGDTQGSTITRDGVLTAGPRAARFELVVRDARCEGTVARAPVEVRGPFAVDPQNAWVSTGGSLRFEPRGAAGSVRYRVVQKPAGDARGADAVVSAEGVFTASSVEGAYELLARDEGGGGDVSLAVRVCAPSRCPTLAPAASVLLVPSAGRVRLDWRGGSGSYEHTVDPESAGTVQSSDDGSWFVSSAGYTGAATVRVRDRASDQRSEVRVGVGDALDSGPVARGSKSQIGDLAVGDVNADGRLDLLVGHAERSRAGFEAGGVLVYYGQGDARFGARDDGEPDVILEGERAGDRFGTQLAVRDVDGDAIDDVVVGSPEADLGGISRGSVSLYLGSRQGLRPIVERVLVGEDRYHGFGSGLVVADVTGDDAVDLVVSAPGAGNPFDRDCRGGRVYVYRNRGRRGTAGVTEPVPWQVLDLKMVAGSGATTSACADRNVGAGRGLALFDADRDGVRDLVVSVVPYGWEVSEWGRAPGFRGAVLIFRGLRGGDAAFERTPAWQIQWGETSGDRERGQSDPRFAYGVDVVTERTNPMDPGRAVLVVRTPFYDAQLGSSFETDVGAFWVFDPERFAPPGAMASDGARTAQVLSLGDARARAVGSEPPWGACRGGGLGRASTVGDVDGDGRNEYVVLASGGRTRVYDLFSDAGVASGALTARAGDIPVVPRMTDMQGRCMDVCQGEDGRCDVLGTRVVAIAPSATAAGQGAGLLRWLSWQNERRAMRPVPYVGTLEWVGPGAGSVDARWSASVRTLGTLGLPSTTSSDRAGASVLVGDLVEGAGIETLVGAPGAHAPPSGTGKATGTLDVIAEGARAAADDAHLWEPPRDDGALGGAGVVALDFDGQPGLEIAVGVPIASTGGSDAPAECRALDESGNLSEQYGQWSRGEVRIYARSAGRWVAKYRFVPRGERAASGAERGRNPGQPRYRQSNFGYRLAVADVNGDGRQDVLVGRTGDAGSQGFDVVLGRALPDDGRVFRMENGRQIASPVVSCEDVRALSTPVPDADAWSAPVYPAGAVTGLGDVSGDGRCEDVAIALAKGAVQNNSDRAGVLVGFDVGPGCSNAGWLYLVADERAFANNRVGEAATQLDDTRETYDTRTGMGAVLAQGRGDLIDDAANDLVFRDANYAPGRTAVPAVEVLSGGCLRDALRALRDGQRNREGALAQVCAEGVSCAWADAARGYFALGVRGLAARCRVVLAPEGLAQRIGAALWVGEVTGSGRAELLVGTPDDSRFGAFAGALAVYRDGNFDAPWVLAAGDVRERGLFGASGSMVRDARAGRVWLVAGAPGATRDNQGVDLGRAYRWWIP